MFDYDSERLIFLKTFQIFQRSLGDRAFSRLNAKQTDLADAFGIYHFEALTLGIQPILDQLSPDDEIQMARLGEAIMSLKKEPEFIGMTKGGGKNSLGLLKRRVAFAAEKLSTVLA